jgi:hypothetical protein
MNIHDLQTDAEIIAEEPTREELLVRSMSPVTRKVGDLVLRPMTSETFTYLWENKNFFLRGVMGEGEVVNKNPVWSTAEFVYIHAADLDRVAADAWDAERHRDNVREFLRGPMNSPQLLTAALPVIEDMVKEYFAVQNEAGIKAAGGASGSVDSGKEQARAGRPAM